MITVTTMAAQGDVLFRRIPLLPGHAREQPRQGPLVVAHSETGHHHVIATPGATLFTTPDPLVCYLRLETEFADVVHERSFHTHETLRLLGEDHGPSYFEVRRQREHNHDSDPDDESDWMYAAD